MQSGIDEIDGGWGRGRGGEGTGATPPPDVFALLRFTFYLSP